MYRCNVCGNLLGWMSDFDVEDVYPNSDYTEGVVGFYSCGKCNLEYEIMVVESELGTSLEIKIYECEDED